MCPMAEAAVFLNLLCVEPMAAADPMAEVDPMASAE